jgi:hypothetical protein
MRTFANHTTPTAEHAGSEPGLTFTTILTATTTRTTAPMLFEHRLTLLLIRNRIELLPMRCRM